MQGIYTYIPETNYVPMEYSVAAILFLLFMVLISLVSALNLLYFYISTVYIIIIIIIIIITATVKNTSRWYIKGKNKNFMKKLKISVVYKQNQKHLSWSIGLFFFHDPSQ